MDIEGFEEFEANALPAEAIAAVVESGQGGNGGGCDETRTANTRRWLSGHLD